MKIENFKNGSDYLQYIQIYCFHEILCLGKSIDDVTIDNYNQFELTDKIISEFNIWVNKGCSNQAEIKKWLTKKEGEFVFFKENFGKKYLPKVSIWSDRKKTTYYKEKLQDAFIFENFIARLLQEQYDIDLGQYLTPEGQYELGENALGIEIKNDTLIKKYGNIYIEYKEKSNSGNYSYIESGILKADNCRFFLIGTEDQFWIFRKNGLIEIYKEEVERKEKGIASERGILFKVKPTSLGFVFPVKYASKEAISIEILVQELNLNFRP